MMTGLPPFARLTNAFSKKVAHAGSLHYMHDNFARVHTTLKTTRAMAAGEANHRWTLAEIMALLD